MLSGYSSCKGRRRVHHESRQKRLAGARRSASESPPGRWKEMLAESGVNLDRWRPTPCTVVDGALGQTDCAGDGCADDVAALIGVTAVAVQLVNPVIRLPSMVNAMVVMP